MCQEKAKAWTILWNHEKVWHEFEGVQHGWELLEHKIWRRLSFKGGKSQCNGLSKLHKGNFDFILYATMENHIIKWKN